ncbi:MAG: AAA family ATPase [Acidobacteria bacterium]|nr:AAA family ATPase [Acidobacteriota bacterium]
MIHQLVIKNFYSIRDTVEIDLPVSKLTPNDENRFAPLSSDTDINAPKVVAFFGPNAAGKSTVLRAPAFVSWFIQHSFGRPAGQLAAPLPCQRFNDVGSKGDPVEISIRFNAPSNLLAGGASDSPHCRYEYELMLGGGDLEPTHVVKERLSYWPFNEGQTKRASKRSKLFERHLKDVSASGSFYMQGFEAALANILRDDVSVISTLVQLRHQPSMSIQKFAIDTEYNILAERFDFKHQDMSMHYYQNRELLEALNRDIQRLDLGIKEVRVDPPKQPNTRNPEARFVHHGLASPLGFTGESHGTRQFFMIFPLIRTVLISGGVAVIDELDTAIHPLLLPEIIRWFYNPERNPKNAQLWLTCQHSSLLGELSKEEVFFCEKDRTGRTSVFGLRDVKPVRRTENYIKKYLSGEYGAVPHIG